MPTTQDLHCGVFDKEHYVVAGKNGACCTASRLDDWLARTIPTTATCRVAFWNKHSCVLATDAGQFIISATAAEALGLLDQDTGLGPSNDDPFPLALTAFAGFLNTYSRADHRHPWTDEVLKSMVGVPNGVAPLDQNNLVPKIHLPPFDINILIEGLKNNLEFVEVESCFKLGPLVSSILHDGASLTTHHSPLTTTLVLVGEAGIGYSTDIVNWQLVENQPFAGIPISVAAGLDDDGIPILIAIDTEKSFSTSYDGKNWTEAVTLEGNYDLSNVAYYNRTFLIVSTNGQILRSQWTNGQLGFVEQADGPEFTLGVTRTCGGSGKWVGVGNDGTIRESLDASHFTPVTSPTTKNLYDVAHGKAMFVAGGEDGVLILTDENGVWTLGQKPFAGNADIMALAYIDTIGMFLVTNRNGEIAVSPDCKDWAKIPSTSTVAIRAITTGLNAIVLGDDLGEISASRKVFEIGDINPGPGSGGTGGSGSGGSVIASTVPFTLLAVNWTGNTNIASVAGLTAETNIDFGIASDVNPTQFDAAVAADLWATATGNGTIIITSRTGVVPTVDIPCLLTVYGAVPTGVTLMQYYLGLYSLPAVNWYIHSDRTIQNGVPDHDNPVSLPLLNTLTQGVEVLGFECYLPVPQDADIPIYNTQGCVLNLTGCNPNWTYSVRVETWAFEPPPNDTQPVKIYDYVYPLAFRPIYGSYIVETNMNMMIHTTAPKFAKQGQVITYKVFVTAVDAIGPTPGTPTMALEVGGTIDSRFTRNQTGITSANSLYATDVNGLPATQGRINYNVQEQLNGLTKRVYQTLAEMQLDPNWRNYDFAMVKE